MYHRFNVEVAKRYGVPCALVLGHIDYLVEKAKADQMCIDENNAEIERLNSLYEHADACVAVWETRYEEAMEELKKAQYERDLLKEMMQEKPSTRKYKVRQIAIIAGRFIGIALLYAMCCIFLFRINRGLENGEIFPKSNISLIRWSALVAALLAFVHSNYDAVVKGESEFMLDSNTILIPLIVLLFAGLYKMAYLAAKDSKLAI